MHTIHIKSPIQTIIYWVAFCLILSLNVSCKKLIEIDPPTNTIITEQVFATDQDAEAAILGIYSKLASKTLPASFGNSWFSYNLSFAADELIPVNPEQSLAQFYRNDYIPQNPLTGSVWTQGYALLYQANSCIEGITASSGITSSTKERLLAEAKFLRAFIYFHLISIFGDVPLVLTSDWQSNMAVKREPILNIQQFLIEELESAVTNLPGDFTLYEGEKIRATKWSAKALLGKLHLTMKTYSKAIAEFTDVIASVSNFSLNDSLNDVFLKNSSEAIWQLYNYGKVYPYNALPEGTVFVPYSNSSAPWVYFSESLLTAFEPGDRRREKWISKTTYNGEDYYYPFKYKFGAAQGDPTAEATEYYMVFRLADIFLLRAEANAKENKLDDARVDLNLIRKRAGLEEVNFSLQNEVLSAVMDERRREMFCEWGNRYFDIMRSDNVNSIMEQIVNSKGGSGWQPFKALLPIFISEIQSNPLCTQNPGYN